MNPRLIPVLALMALVVPDRGRALEARAEAPGDLIELMGSESYPVRVKATDALWALGEKALPLLEDAVDDPNPEVATRARGLVRKVRLGILPDSPPEVVGLVVQYDEATPMQRRKIIENLKRLQAWRQMLKIHELERDPETLRAIDDEMKGVAVQAAREELVREEPDLEAAREFLAMGRMNLEQLISLAEFHRMNGTLERELELAADIDGQEGHLRRYALQLIGGNLSEAIREAKAADEPRAAARLQLLQGDPFPWLEGAEPPQGQIPPARLDDYLKAVKNLWNGRQPPRKLVTRLENSVRDADDEESWHSLGLLFALGEVESGEEALERLSPALAFGYFDIVERVDEALEALGFDPEAPDYEGWMAERFEVVLENYDQADDELTELKLLGSFLQSRGMDEVLRETFVPPLVELGEADPEVFVVVASDFFSYYRDGAARRAVIEASAKFADEDEIRGATVREAFFGDNSHVEALSESIQAFRPGIDAEGHLEVLATVLGMLPDTAGEADRWWQWAMAEADRGVRAARADLYGLLLTLSMFNPAADRFVAAAEAAREAGFELDELGLFAEEYRFAGFELLSQAALGDWGVYVENWREQTAKAPTDPVRHAYLAGALRRAGQEEEAAATERLVERLALGRPGDLMRIGQAFATAGDFRLAADWWHRAALLSLTDREFYQSALLLVDEAKEQEDWQLAAALGELNLHLNVMSGNRVENPAGLLRLRIEVEMARALSILETDREQALTTLERCYKASGSDGSMADYFFPALRKAGLTERHDRWFEHSWGVFMKVLERFPDSHNTMNTAAWTASRANRRVDEAEELVRGALERFPGQAAYLDTLGEVWFCREDREKALEWSSKAVARMVGQPGLSGLLRQYERFRTAPFPVD